MKIELPLGDIVDRAAILQIKSERIGDKTKLVNVIKELATINKSWEAAGYPAMSELEDWGAILEVNGKLWNVEDELRAHERKQDFSATFVELARSVYFLNDHRSRVKRRIGEALGSELMEEKSYQEYAKNE